MKAQILNLNETDVMIDTIQHLLKDFNVDIYKRHKFYSPIAVWRNWRSNNWNHIKYEELQPIEIICNDFDLPCESNFFDDLMTFAYDRDKFYEALCAVNSNKKLHVLSNAIIKLRKTYDVGEDCAQLGEFIAEFDQECQNTYVQICKILKPEVNRCLNDMERQNYFPNWLPNGYKERVVNNFARHVQEELDEIEN